MIDIKHNTNGSITIKISAAALRHNVKMHHNLPEGSKVTDINEFSEAVFLALEAEEEDGTNLAHIMLDNAVERAIEDGCYGVELGDE